MVLLVIGALTLVVLVYWLLQGKRGALLAVIFTAFLLNGTQFAQTVDPSDLDSVRGAFLFGAVAAGVAVAVPDGNAAFEVFLMALDINLLVSKLPQPISFKPRF